MTFQRGDVVLIPFPYSDLTARKTRPAVVVSDAVYHSARSEFLLAYISSQLSSANEAIDYVLQDWRSTHLLKPSFVRPKIAAIEPSLVVHQVGSLSAQDLSEVDRRLRIALSLPACVRSDIVDEVDFLAESPSTVQILAEKATMALVTFATADNPAVDLARLRKLL
jgi:mRNA interferase MazF